MSSAILYLAIVAIWAFLLVPRWIRRSHAPPAPPLTGDDAADADAFPESEQLAAESPEPTGDPLQDDEPDTAPIPAIIDPAVLPADASSGAFAPEPDGPPARPRRPVNPPISRAKILQARRRLMTTLVLLGIAAVGGTLLGLTSAWVCVPPVIMLGMYALLLREAALADTDNARRRAREAHIARQRARQRAREAWAARTPQPTAQIIDISSRLGDQLYDQYADATVRAVGD